MTLALLRAFNDGTRERTGDMNEESKMVDTACASAWEYHGGDIPARLEDVAEVIAEACTPGDSGYAEEEIVGIFRLKSGEFLYVSGGCDTTGWDCQSSASGTIYNTLADLVRSSVTDDDKRILSLSIDGDVVTIGGNCIK